MKSIHVAVYEEAHLLHWRRAEDILVGPLGDLLFHILYTGHYVCRESFCVHRRNLDSFLLVLTTEGEGCLRYQDKEYLLTPGTVMLIDARAMHSYFALTEGWTFWFIQFRGAMSQAYADYLESRFGPVFPLGRSEFSRAQSQLEVLLQLTEADQIRDYGDISARIYSLLTSFLSPEHDTEISSKSAAAVRRAADYLRVNHGRSISVQEVADYVYLSRPYLTELFGRTYGMSPHEYLTQYRLSRARDLLLNTDKTVSEIGEACGFRDVFSFSRGFRKKFGLSPTQFRKQVR